MKLDKHLKEKEFEGFIKWDFDDRFRWIKIHEPGDYYLNIPKITKKYPERETQNQNGKMFDRRLKVKITIKEI